MAVLFPQLQFFDNNGAPLALGKVYTYITGTTTPKSTWTTAAESANHPNPVILDDEGRAEIWLSTDSEYRVTIKSATDATIQGPIDAVTGVGIQLSSFSQLSSNLDVNGYDIVSTNNGNIDIDPHGTGDVNLGGDTAITGTLSVSSTITPTGGWVANTVYNPGYQYLGSISITAGIAADTSIFSTRYRRYKLIFGAAGGLVTVASGDQPHLVMQMYNGAYVTAGYETICNGFDTAGAAITLNGTGGACFNLVPNPGTNGQNSYILGGEIDVSINNSFDYVSISGTLSVIRNTTVGTVTIGGQVDTGATTVTGFKLLGRTSGGTERAVGNHLTGSVPVIQVFGLEYDSDAVA